MSDFSFDNLFAAFDSTPSLAFSIFLIIAYLLGIITGLLLRGSRIRKLRKELKERDAAYQELVVLKEEGEKELAVSQASLQQLKLEREDVDTRIRMLESDKDQLNTDLNVTLNQYRQLQQDISSYESTIADLRQRLEAKTEQANTSDENIIPVPFSGSNESSGNNFYSENTSTDVQDMYAQTRSRLAALEDKINRLEQENNALQDDVQKLSQHSANAPTEMYNPVAFSQPRNAEVIGKRINVDENIEKDDLTLINGVGPFLERKLNEARVYTYQQISTWSRQDIEEVTPKIGFFPGKIEEDNWVGQAARLQQMKLDNPAAFSKEESHPNNPKDLKIIAGIGPKTEALLKDGGINNWVELASTHVERLRAILRDAGAPFDTLNPSTWPEQARLASNGEWERFEDYQGYLGVD
jgi:predicted flap endonuclease-1-like 5' DNA nuclease/flagellar biosynthesis chaperone FliJ